jgi:glycine betaine/proline transport system substrate-binding protein
MTAALERAARNEDWIVVTGWSPHWKFGAWDLRYIDDPKGVLGSWERIHAIARQGFYQDNIDAATMLGRMWIPIDDLQAAMYEARETSYEEAVTKYIENNGDRVEYWVSGEM